MKFIKAEGLGNDFVLIDLDANEVIDDLSILAQKISNRRYGIGCDQILFYKGNQVWFYNADGSEAESCGNGTRCLAKLLMDRANTDHITIQTKGGVVECSYTKNHDVRVVMPRPTWHPIEIQARNNIFTHTPLFVTVGNPHLVCFVENMDYLHDLGPILSKKQNSNVDFVQVVNDHQINLKTWERGAGITPACGSGSCASVVACVHKGLTGNSVEVFQEGGVLQIEYNDPELTLTGAANIVFEGNFKK